MPKSIATCNKFLALVYNGTAWADIAENDASGPLTNLYVALHTADPGTGNNQTTNEAAYTNYARVAVVRTTSGWAVPSAGETSNAALVQFPACGASGATITHVSVGTAASGTGNVIHAGPLDSALAVALGITPQFDAGALKAVET